MDDFDLNQQHDLIPTSSLCHLDDLAELNLNLDGEIFWDDLVRKLYSTDASVYQEMPLAVAFPKNQADIGRLIQFANKHRIGLIPRTAGTSLAGQVVGSGIVVDVSRYMNQILEIDTCANWVRVQPGVIRDELNRQLAADQIFFAPETSTANRAMIGGMIGNNSCGANSIVYGSTRDHLLEVSGYLSDGTFTTFATIDRAAMSELIARQPTDSLLNQIHSEMLSLVDDPSIQQQVQQHFPAPNVYRRNTGYAVDRLLGNDPINFSHLIAGSEGTLFFITEAKLNCVPLPPPVNAILAIHFTTLDQAMQATRVVMQHAPFGCELIDHLILEGASRNLQQTQNLGFVSGNPRAILIVEFRGMTRQHVQEKMDAVCQALRPAELGYDFPVLWGAETNKVWELRKAGLGIVSNLPGDTKPVAVIEDTAVAVDDLPLFIQEINHLLKQRFGIECVHYAHAGAGELHLRPQLNLKTEQGQQLFRQIATEVALLVKKYRGSLSGEHGDGRLRAEFIPIMIGQENYHLLRRIKKIWDPHKIFNPGKIVDAPPMDQHLRYSPNQPTRELATVFDFSTEQGIQRAAELCNGSGDCRKTQQAGGTMCPSYMATKNEKDTTRGRANILRQILTDPIDASKPFDNQELMQVMDLCLSCKGCKNECPSNVDMAKLKAEVLQGYYDVHGVPRRSKKIATYADSMALAAKWPAMFNWLVSNRWIAPLIKNNLGFTQQRPIPQLHPFTLRNWLKRRQTNLPAKTLGKVILFIDEFTNYNDVPVGIAAVELLERLGFEIVIPAHAESGRAAISKGMLRHAKKIAEQNVTQLSHLVNADLPLIGIEPSAILSFRDEYPVLVSPEMRPQANHLATNTLMIDEFVEQLIDRNQLRADRFTDSKQKIRLHGHCHQKALASLRPSVRMLQLPKNYSVKLIPSGCCGMAGSFGYEKEHYQLSMEIGELVLFPTIRAEPENCVIAAAGTSCRHQIFDGTGRIALHPIQILRSALT